MGAEQEVDRVDHPEEAHGFENQAGKDAERGQDSDERGQQKPKHHAAFDPRSCGKVRFEAKKRESSRSERDQEGYDQANGIEASDRLPERRNEPFGRWIEHRRSSSR